MNLVLAQFNSLVGDVRGNAARMVDVLRSPECADADLVVFPELAVSGYPPKDLVLSTSFIDLCASESALLGEAARAALKPGATLVFGVPLPIDLVDDLTGGPVRRGVTNSLLAFRDGAQVACYHKRLLPTYDVFDEDRYFVAGETPCVIDVPTSSAGRLGKVWRVGLSICEDLWRGEDAGFSHRYLSKPDPVGELVRQQPDASKGAELIVNPSASPFVLGKGRRHRAILSGHATRHRVFVAAVNAVGGNDELVFDGFACAYSPAGVLLGAGPGFEQRVVRVAISPDARGVPDPALQTSDDEQLFRALTLGVRDYLRKTGFKTCVLGLSGGIDSAVTAVIAAAALGPTNVMGVRLPSRYSSSGSLTDAQELADRLGIDCHTVPIESAFESLEASLRPVFAGRSADVTEENLQSRVRGTVLMAISNKFGRLLLTTGNKSELAVGYCTLYGDMNGGLAVLSDVTKHWVYRLARWINQHPGALGIEGLTKAPIPEASITKPPSAELRPNQTDQDSLPPYDELDDILERYVVARQSPDEIVREGGHDPKTVARVVRLIDVSEFKRKQAAIGIKVTGVAFGSGRRMPIAQGYRPEREL